MTITVVFIRRTSAGGHSRHSREEEGILSLAVGIPE
jgi:hypothetical protein